MRIQRLSVGNFRHRVHVRHQRLNDRPALEEFRVADELRIIGNQPKPRPEHTHGAARIAVASGGGMQE